MQHVVITELKNCREHTQTIADRLWRAWWEPYGRSLSDVEAALDEVLAADGFPFTLVATCDGRFIGTVTAIQSDIHQRPELGPCVAALWVEPDERGQGVAHMLMSEVLERLGTRGFAKAYLSAKPHLHGFYGKAGWSLVETEVGEDRLGVFVRALP